MYATPMLRVRDRPCRLTPLNLPGQRPTGSPRLARASCPDTVEVRWALAAELLRERWMALVGIVTHERDSLVLPWPSEDKIG
jgi:hypothetical protein